MNSHRDGDLVVSMKCCVSKKADSSWMDVTIFRIACKFSLALEDSETYHPLMTGSVLKALGQIPIILYLLLPFWRLDDRGRGDITT